MSIPNNTARKERERSHEPFPLTPPRSAEKPPPPPLSSNHSSQIQRAVQIVKSIKSGHPPNSSWVRLHLGRGGLSQLKEQLNTQEGLWSYVQDKIRFDYDPASCYLIFRMPSIIHEVFTASVVEEIKFHIRRISEDISRPNDAAIAGSIKFCASGDIELNSGSRDDGGTGEDEIPYLQAVKVIDNKPFRNGDLPPIQPDSALLLPLSAFADPDASTPSDAVISIPYTTLGSFLEDAERDQEEMKGHSRCGYIQKLPPGTQLLKR
ncbi:MAG: hypothetical protein M1840_000841 [Geoglossum simile]|nr:MAG: hypothetical protein M1840_000841 [Geoglossum simile]